MLKSTNPLFLTIDGGGTKTKVTISTYTTSSSQPPDQNLPPTIQILSTATHRSSNYSDLGIHSAIQSITQAVQIALQSLSLTWIPNTVSPFTRIWAGLSGVDSPTDIKIMHQAISELFALDPTSTSSDVEVSNDCDLLAGPIEFHYLESKRSGSKVCQGGIVLIAGTGSIATAYTPHHPHPNQSVSLDSSTGLRVLGRVGGYGYLIGDEGSAYDVGKRTMKAILEYSDTLDNNVKEHDALNLVISKSSLLPMILDHYGVQRLGDLLGSVYKLDQSKHETEHHRKIRVAEVSRLVMRAAFPPKEHQADGFALKIMQETGHELSQLLRKICVTHQLVPDQMVLSLGGGMWAYDQFRELLVQTTRQEWDAEWGWVERVNEPDETAAITLVNRYLKNIDY